MSDEILRQILAELQKQTAALQPVRCSNADHILLSRLIPTISEIFGSSHFTSRDVLNDSICAAIVCDMNTVQLGALLSRALADQVDVQGLIVQRHSKRDHNQSMWLVLRLTS